MSKHLSAGAYNLLDSDVRKLADLGVTGQATTWTLPADDAAVAQRYKDTIALDLGDPPSAKNNAKATFAIQKFLAEQARAQNDSSLDPGGVDGAPGPKTKAAIDAFIAKQDNGAQALKEKGEAGLKQPDPAPAAAAPAGAAPAAAGDGKTISYKGCDITEDRKAWPETPFHLVGQNFNGWFASLGDAQSKVDELAKAAADDAEATAAKDAKAKADAEAHTTKLTTATTQADGAANLASAYTGDDQDSALALIQQLNKARDNLSESLQAYGDASSDVQAAAKASLARVKAQIARLEPLLGPG
jgi:hypothetical protein